MLLFVSACNAQWKRCEELLRSKDLKGPTAQDRKRQVLARSVVRSSLYLGAALRRHGNTPQTRPHAWSLPLALLGWLLEGTAVCLSSGLV